MKNFYFIIAFSLLTTATFAQQWEDLNLRSEDDTFISLSEFPNFIEIQENNEIYALYTFIERLQLSGLAGPSPEVNLDPDFDLSIKFKKYNGSFTDLALPLLPSPPFSYGTDDIASNNNEPYFAFRNSSAKLSVLKFNGSNWQSIGPANVSAQNADEINIGFDPSNAPYVIYRGLNSGFKLYVKQYVAPNWIDVGAPYVPITTPSNPFVAFANDGTPYITFQDNGVSNYILVKKFNSTSGNWDDVSSSEISSGISQLGGLVVINGMPYVAFRDQGTGFDIQVKRFNGTNWELVGSSIVSTSGTAIKMKKTVSGVIYVTYISSSGITVKRLIGDDWVVVGAEGFNNAKDNYDFDVNDNNNCVVIFRDVSHNPEINYFDGNTLTTGTIETGRTYDITAYPNPVSNTLKIVTDLSIEKIVIYNNTGQQVMESTLATINTSNLSSGMYFVKVKTEGGTSFRTIKILKK